MKLKPSGRKKLVSTVKLIQRETGMSQAEIGKKLGVHNSTVCGWMKGKSLPRAGMKDAILRLKGEMVRQVLDKTPVDRTVITQPPVPSVLPPLPPMDVTFRDNGIYSRGRLVGLVEDPEILKLLADLYAKRAHMSRFVERVKQFSSSFEKELPV